MENNLEGVLTIVKNGELLVVVYKDNKKKANIFYACQEMTTDQIKSLLDSYTENEV